MAATLPAKLRTSEVTRFAIKATQLEKFNPIITYWCEYYILQYVLNRNLHQADEECQSYALNLMDKLEQYKANNSTNDAVVDDVAAKAYVENFALDTFNRADNSIRANKATKQTAETLIAAGTFIDLLSIWGEVDSELMQKSKWGRVQAKRILTAVKAGEDPNLSNPVVEEKPQPPPEDGLDAELKNLEQAQNGVGGSVYRPPTVESAEHSGVPSRPESAMQDQPSAPPPIPQQTPTVFAPPSAPLQPQEHEVSPIEPPENTDDSFANVRQNSIGGGYFPSVADQPTDQPADISMRDVSQQPTAPPPAPAPSVQTPQSPMNPQDFYNTNVPPPVVPSPGAVGLGSPHRPDRPTPTQMTAQPPAVPYVPSPAPQIPPQPTPQLPPQPAPVAAQYAPPVPPVQTGPPPGGYKTDDESTMLAQKHARWAISALNFEDVNTAVKELRLALQSLGAT
jgi:vacuolar protein sorting-associated protein VTA1